MKKLSFEDSLSIVIPVYNEAATIENVLLSCISLRPKEVIVVANGCTDETVDIVKKFPAPIKLITVEKQLGNDVGRAVGAKEATGEVLLFLDADFVISKDELLLFLQPIMNGEADVVLNDFTKLFYEKKRPHSITVWRQIVNTIIGKSNLGIDSILSVPHAFTKKAVNSIGWENLAHPILSHILLVSNPALVIHRYPIEVISKNRFRPSEHQVNFDHLSKSEKRMIGDHLYGLAHILQEPRGGFSDGGRNRATIEEIKQTNFSPKITTGWKTIDKTLIYGGKTLSVIIPAQNEAKTIQSVIQQARKIEPLEIIVVVNGSSDHTAEVAKAYGATTIEINERLGNDVGRSIGAKYAKGDILLFIDGDFLIPANDLFPFAKAIANGVDLSLNDLNHYLDLRFPLNIVTALKYAVNLAHDSKGLGVSSMIAVPHGLSRKALNIIGWDSLVSPVVAQSKVLLENNLIAKTVHRVEVDKLNKIRPEEHFAKRGFAPAVERIIGDHVEGLYYLLSKTSKRGLFQNDHRYFGCLTPKKDILR